MKAAAGAAADLYGYGHGKVLFKPTKAAEYPFRPVAADAMSYFVGEPNVAGGYKEDAGFAINGGEGLVQGRFREPRRRLPRRRRHRHGHVLLHVRHEQGHRQGRVHLRVQAHDDGKVRICLHHSSVPYAAAKK